MHKKRKSSIVINNVYMIIGKTVVFTGAFCGVFYLLGTLFELLEPYVSMATTFCIENSKWLFISLFVIALLIWGTYRIFEEIAIRRQMKEVEIKDSVE